MPGNKFSVKPARIQMTIDLPMLVLWRTSGVKSDALVEDALPRSVTTEALGTRVQRNAQSHSGRDSHRIWTSPI
jgi:hypothetical protein